MSKKDSALNRLKGFLAQNKSAGKTSTVSRTSGSTSKIEVNTPSDKYPMSRTESESTKKESAPSPLELFNRRYMDGLISSIQEKVKSGDFSQEDATTIYDALNGKSKHISLRSTKGVDEKFLASVKYFRPDVDYFVYGQFINIGRLNAHNRGVETEDLSMYTKEEKLILQGPFIYTADEMGQIVKEIKEIEKGLNPSWTDFQKFVYLQNYIISTIGFNSNWRDTLEDFVPPYNSNRCRYENHSLRGLISRKTICLGYSVILGELLNRQGIENHLNVNTDHAYSIVKIGGKYYVTDPTTENSMLECTGRFNKPRWAGVELQEFFAEPDHKMEITLFPHRPNPELYVMDKDEYLQTLDQVLLMKNYDRISYHLNYKNQDIYISQIGFDMINGWKYHRYLYQTSTSEHVMPVVVYTRENLSDFVYTKRKNKKIDPEYEKLLLSIIDPANVAQSVRQFNGDLGSVFYQPDLIHIDRVARKSKETAQLGSSVDIARRNDGTLLVIVPKKGGDKQIAGNKLFAYDVFVRKTTGNRLTYRGFCVYTERDFSSYRTPAERECLINGLLCDDSLFASSREIGGYIGSIRTINDTSRVVKNPKYAQYFLAQPKGPSQTK